LTDARAKRWGRAARAVLLLSAGAMLTLSCRDFVEGTTFDAWQRVCERFEQCTGSNDTCQRLRPELEAADEETRQGWLERISVACEATCGTVRSCLDAEPTCAANDTPCDERFVCCGVTAGLAQCDPGRGACCGSPGSTCSPTSVCCAGLECKTNANGVDTCGGRVCAGLEEKCATDEECCSRVCSNDRCSRLECIEPGGPCASKGDCCDGAECFEGTCGASCGELDEPCGFGGSCCDLENTICIAGMCRASCENGPCSNAESCCPAFTCQDGLCTLEAVTCHDVCTVGPKMNPISCGFTCPSQPDAYCTQVAWDESCVLLAEYECMQPCP
jgi:hypothetical protein